MAEKLIITANSNFHRKFTDTTLTHEEVVDYFADTGFGGIDYDFESLAVIGLPHDELVAYAAALGERAAAHGLNLSFGHLPFHKKLAQDAEGNFDKVRFDYLMFTAMDIAVAMGAKRAVIHPKFSKDPAEDHERQHRRNLEYLTPYMNYAARVGLTLLVENMPSYTQPGEPMRYCGNAAEIAAVADYFGCGNCWDAGHATLNHLDQRAELNLLGKRLQGIHLQDNTGHSSDDHLIPFFGTTDWAGVTAGLADVGYSGTFNFECRTRYMPRACGAYVGQHLLTVANVLLDMYEKALTNR